MNERIKELYGDALDKAVPHTWHNLDHVEVEKIMKEFAELIVRECIDTVYKRGEAYAIASAGFYQAKTFSEAIMEHFGVEE